MQIEQGARFGKAGRQFVFRISAIDGSTCIRQQVTTQYGAHKYIVIARTLLSRIAMLSADFDTAAEEITAACSMLKRYPALLCAWRAHAMLGRIEMQCGNPDGGIRAYRLAVSNIRYVAGHIDDKRLRSIFLSSDAIRDVLRDAGERICTE